MSEQPARPRSTLFSVPFHSCMTDAHLARLHASLDLVTYMKPKPGVGEASPGVVRLDFWSGLFLVRGDGENEWLLKGATWGKPAQAAVREWHIRVALAARELDPAVEIPHQPPALADKTRSLSAGSAANRRRARLGRRLLGPR